MIAISCEKIELDKNCGRNFKGKSEIIIGDEEGMDVQVFDMLLMGNRIEEHSFSIDIDNDCIADFTFTSDVWGSAGLGSHGVAKIIYLSQDAFTFREPYNDTTYYKFESNIYEGENGISLGTHTRYLCSERTDSIHSIEINLDRVIPLEKGDKLNKNGDFRTTESILTNDNVGTSNFGYNQDTAYTHYINYENDCYDFPDGKVRYIGVKLLGRGKRKMGWIKLTIFNGYQILLMETAIEM